MIIIRLKGGLGNQMFQYAAARKLSHAYNTGLKLDLTWFKNVSEVDTSRKYLLDKFAIDAEVADPELLRELVESYTHNSPGLLRKIIDTVSRHHHRAYVVEDLYASVPKIYHRHGEVYLDGYWQSEKYFYEVENIIRDEFTVSNPPDIVNRQIQENIHGSTAVSVHVRRGDYVHNPRTNMHHGLCELEYYHKAMDIISRQVESPHFFVFSDDPAWVRVNLHPSYPFTVVDHNGADQAHEDLRLISMCQHHIIANSTLSWWGAWLCRDSHKLIIAPEKWFNNVNRDTSELLPKTWITL